MNLTERRFRGAPTMTRPQITVTADRGVVPRFAIGCGASRRRIDSYPATTANRAIVATMTTNRLPVNARSSSFTQADRSAPITADDEIGLKTLTGGGMSPIEAARKQTDSSPALYRQALILAATAARR